MTNRQPEAASPPDGIPRRLLRLGQQQPAYLLVAITLGLVAGLAVIGQASLLSQSIEAVFLGGAGLDRIRTPLILLVGLAGLRALAVFASETCAARFASDVQQRLRRDLAGRLFALGPAYTSGERSGDLVTTAIQSVDALEAFFAQVLPQIAYAALLPLSIAIVLLPRDWPSALLMLLTAPLIPLFLWLIGGAAQTMTRRQWRALRWMSTYFYDILQGLTTLKSLNLSVRRIDDVADVSDRYRSATLRVLRVGFLSAFVLEIVATLSTAVIAVEIGLRLLYAHMAFGPALFILLLAPEFYLPLRTLGLRFHAATAGLEAARRIVDLLDAPLPARPAHGRRLTPAKLPPAVSLRRVRFTYPARSRPALDDVSLDLPAGRLTVLLGASGSGKSTLAALLLRFIDPDAGGVLVNGDALADLDLEAWRAGIAWIPQRPHLIHASLEDNLRLGSPAAPPARLEQALERAGLVDVLTHLPAGLATPLGERGERLSAGQAQRVAIARALLTEAPLFVFDEPTSALDVETEAAVQRSLAEAASGRTALVITHRLSWLAFADQACLLAGGRVVQVGPPESLRRAPGAMRDILLAAEAG